MTSRNNGRAFAARRVSRSVITGRWWCCTCAGPTVCRVRRVEKVLQDPTGFRAELLGKFAHRSQDPNIAVEYDVVMGDPIDEILHAAEARHCGLIVMNTHGRQGARRLLMGSVAEGVLRRAPCPVITLGEPAKMPAVENVSRTPSIPACVP